MSEALNKHRGRGW